MSKFKKIYPFTSLDEAANFINWCGPDIQHFHPNESDQATFESYLKIPSEVSHLKKLSKESLIYFLALTNWHCDKFEQYKKYADEKIEELSKGLLNAEVESVIELKLGKVFAASDAGRHAANVNHSKPGGSREKQQRIRDIWATGKYTNRDRCAEEECGGLNMSLSSARKALRNTPDPS